MILSNSRMKSLWCPCQFQMRYLRPWVERSSIPALKGKIGHRGAEFYIAHLARKHWKRDFEAYTRIMLDLTKDEPPHIAEPVLQVAERFVQGWMLDTRAKLHRSEVVLVVDRDHQPATDFSSDDDGNLYPMDRDLVSGRLDYQAVYRGGTRSSIWDFKMGELHVDLDAAKHNPQLQLYAALDFWHNPERESVEVVIWGVKYGTSNLSRFTYGRQHACQEEAERIERNFDKLDTLYSLLPDDDWPALAVNYETCRYCPIAHICPPNVRDIEDLMAGPRVVKQSKPRSKK